MGLTTAMTMGLNMFNVYMEQLKQPLKNRELTYVTNIDGSVKINGINFNSEYQIERYLLTITRKDFK
jgi:hypothetical protein